MHLTPKQAEQFGLISTRKPVNAGEVGEVFLRISGTRVLVTSYGDGKKMHLLSAGEEPEQVR